jgi:hypothetical protein
MRSDEYRNSLKRELSELLNNRQQYSSVDEVFRDLLKLVSKAPSSESYKSGFKSLYFKHYKPTDHLYFNKEFNKIRKSQLMSESPKLRSKDIDDREFSRQHETSEWGVVGVEENTVSKNSIKSVRISQKENPSIEDEWPEECPGIIMPQDLKLRVKIPKVVHVKNMCNYLQIEQRRRSIATRIPRSELKADPGRQHAIRISANHLLDDSISSFDYNLGSRLRSYYNGLNFNSMKNLETPVQTYTEKNKRTKITAEESTLREGVH